MCSWPAGAVIGRSRDCDIVLDDAGVSRKHAEIRPSGDGWTVADLGSTNGVLVNGLRSAPRASSRPATTSKSARPSSSSKFMNSLEPISVALKFGFLAVLYLFLFWVARSARRDLAVGQRGPRRGRTRKAVAGGRDRAAFGVGPRARGRGMRSPRLVVVRAPGHSPGMIYDLDGEIVLGRGERAEIRLQDPFASSRHALIYEQGNIVVIEDLDSTNGTYLNEELLQSPRPLHPGDRIRIGDSEFEFEAD